MKEEKVVTLTQYVFLLGVLRDVEPYLSTDRFLDLMADVETFASRDSLVGPNPFAHRGNLHCVSSLEFRADYLVRKILSKVEPMVSNASADAAGVNEFLSVNEKASRWSPKWIVGASRDDVYDNYRRIVCDEMKFSLHKILVMDDKTALTLRNMRKHVGTGPGASTGSDCSSFFTKTSFGPLAATGCAVRDIYLGLISGTLWGDAEEQRSKLWGEIQIINFNKLFPVPKNTVISRIAATECGCNMVVQKTIGEVLSDALRLHLGIDINNQQLVNRVLSRVGSVTGEFVTIDLKGASDLVSINNTSFIMPDQVMDLLKVSRSPYILVPSTDVKKAFKRKLNMVGTMGNGFTFPLQTLLFTTLVLACYKTLNIKAIKPVIAFNKDGEPYVLDVGNYSVFGDDIIVVSKAFGLVRCMLASLGLLVNEKKTFDTGGFRESCGGDFYYGSSVKPVYIKGFEQLHDHYGNVNKVIEWSALNNMPLPRVTRLLYEQIPQSKRLFVPRLESEHGGIRFPEAYLPPSYYRLRNSKYANPDKLWFYNILTIKKSVQRCSRVISLPPIDILPDESQSEEMLWGLWNCGEGLSKAIVTKDAYFSFYCGNPSGYLLSALQGSVLGHELSQRGNPSTQPCVYVDKSITTFSWEYGGSFIRKGDSRVVINTLDNRLSQLGLADQRGWKHLFDIYEFKT